MRYRIRRVPVGPLVKMCALLYGVCGLIFAPMFLVMSVFDPDLGIFGGVFALVMPLFYAVMGAISALVGAALYNWFASMIGGVEVELDGVEAGPVPGGSAA